MSQGYFMVWYKASFPKTRATLFFHGKLLKSALKYGMLGEIVQGHLHGSLPGAVAWLAFGGHWKYILASLGL